MGRRCKFFLFIYVKSLILIILICSQLFFGQNLDHEAQEGQVLTVGMKVEIIE